MKKTTDALFQFHDNFVHDDCVQISLGFKKYLMIFGDGDLRYFKNFLYPVDNIQKDKNLYLEDSRRDSFPYSTIPERVEKVSLFKKRLFVNQIFDFNKPYVLVRDGFLLKSVAYKDDEKAYIYGDSLIEKESNQRELFINREQLEEYFKKGILSNYDSNNYVRKYIFNADGCILDENIKPEYLLLEKMKRRLRKEVKDNADFDDIIYFNLLKAIEDMQDMVSCIIVDECCMIKFKDNGDIVIDKFSIKYYKKDKYIIRVSNIPVKVDTLEMISSKVQLSKIRMLTEPKVSLRLNPNIKKEQLDMEKCKIKKDRKRI